MANPNDNRPEGAPRHVHIEKNQKVAWLPWLLLALGILGLLLALSRCNRHETAAVSSSSNETASDVVATTPNAETSTTLMGTSALGTYLAGNEATPRTFTFEKLNFDTGKSAVRANDTAEIGQVATTLHKYEGARVRIAGYADARGSDQANLALGKARAEAIKTALVGHGIAADRIETTSGGERDPVDTNATAGGRFENRRTELVVTAR